jgi:glycosyltransferase involved in cell wall biosynthesis
MLSIIVANYNKGGQIRDCLESILRQTEKNIEIITVDDGSTDESIEVIKEYELNYPQLIRAIFFNKNQGVAKARHEAILKSRGEYITTLDSDDYYCDQRKLERELELIHYHRVKHCEDILAFSKVWIKLSGNNMFPAHECDTRLKEGILSNCIISRSCFIPRDFTMKRSTYFDVGGYDPSLSTYEDWDLKIRLSKSYPFYCTHLYGVTYRRLPGGLSSRSYVLNTRNLWKVFHKNISLFCEEDRKNIRSDFSTFMQSREKNFPKNHREIK